MNPNNRRDFIVGAGAVVATSLTGCATYAETAKQSGTPKLGARAYALQNKVKGLTIPDSVTVIGCGGFGTWPALFSAICGVKKMLLIDASDVDEIDMARTPFRPTDIGKPKAIALRELIHVFRPEVEIRAEKRFIEPADADVYFGSVLFDGTNYKPLSKSLPEESAKRGIRYIHGFYNGNVVGTADHYEEVINYIPGNEIPVWAGAAAFSGAIAMFSAFVAPINFVGTPESLTMAGRQFGNAIQTFGGGMHFDK